MRIVNSAGNPRVILSVPVPVPTKTPTRGQGYGFFRGTNSQTPGFTRTRTRGGLPTGYPQAFAVFHK